MMRSNMWPMSHSSLMIVARRESQFKVLGAISSLLEVVLDGDDLVLADSVTGTDGVALLYVCTVHLLTFGAL